ncbi:class I SAM-dependent methyltransferase [Azotobacter beijerinckii]|uniref:Methyltransferase domain-containing protein n=1 Tax=Azotobacter beijerinckii TaxID=170623 RepID=A0A1I4EJT7_9GAMM|nr:methyltransferase domain-containing protein [Azotobacter beijerinckii]SFL04837.1 Methyltransferase domain-containing protein [Azotobacter beijerinckii]
MSDTHRYYETQARQFFAETVGLEMGELHRRFLDAIPAGGHLLDAGCGSGRDAKAFLARGYRVTAFDASPALAGLASEHLGQSVAVRRFAEVEETALYDGIWACRICSLSWSVRARMVAPVRRPACASSPATTSTSPTRTPCAG